MLSRSKKPPSDEWRLNDKEFDDLHNFYKISVEGCCVTCEFWGFNGHKGLPFYFEQNSLMDHNVSGQSVYCNPPWSIAIQCVEHLRVSHYRSPLETRAVVVLPDWPKFKAITKELKLIKQLPKVEMVIMMTSPTCTYDPRDIIPFICPNHFWLIDANTPVLYHRY
jgi:hypothetical protein